MNSSPTHPLACRRSALVDPQAAVGVFSFDEDVVAVINKANSSRLIGAEAAWNFGPAMAATAQIPPVEHDPAIRSNNSSDASVADGRRRRSHVGDDMRRLPANPDTGGRIPLIEIDGAVGLRPRQDKDVGSTAHERGARRRVGAQAASGADLAITVAAAAEIPPVVEDTTVRRRDERDATITRRGGCRRHGGDLALRLPANPLAAGRALVEPDETENSRADQEEDVAAAAHQAGTGGGVGLETAGRQLAPDAAAAEVPPVDHDAAVGPGGHGQGAVAGAGQGRADLGHGRGTGLVDGRGA